MKKMKKMRLFLLMLFVTVTSFAQKDPVDRLFEKYGGKDGFTTVYITSKMFSMFSDVNTEDPEFNKMMKNLKSIRILATDENAGEKQNVNFYDEVMKELPAEEYEELMVVQQKDQKLKFLVREKEGKIIELLLVVGGVEDNAVIDIRGLIDLKQIAELSKAIHVSAMEELEKLNNKDNKENKK